LFDVGKDKAVGRKILDDRGAANAQIAWSPDGELVAMAEMYGIRVLSISKSEIVAHREFDLRNIEIDGVRRGRAVPTVAFRVIAPRSGSRGRLGFAFSVPLALVLTGLGSFRLALAHSQARNEGVKIGQYPHLKKNILRTKNR
jgi:hypothetical protein